MELGTAWEFGSALGLGILIGLERERTRGDKTSFAGVRTFSLVALLGAVSVYASELSGLPWLVGLVFFAVHGHGDNGLPRNRTKKVISAQRRKFPC